MPIIDVKGVGSVEFPDSMSEAEITEALRKSFPAENKPKTSDSKAINTFREGLQGMTFGLSDEIGAAAATIPALLSSGQDITWDNAQAAYTDMRDAIRAEQNAFREENPKTAMAANLVGGIASGVPGKIIKSAGTVVNGALSGMAAGSVSGYGFSDATNAVDQVSDAGTGAVTGAVLGAAIPAAANKAASLWKQFAARGGINLTDDAGRITDDAILKLKEAVDKGVIKASEAGQLSDDLVKSGVLSPEQLKKAQLFQKYDVPILKANLTGSTDDFRMVNEARKTTGPISQAVAQQDSQMTKAVSDGIERMRPNAQNIQETNSNVFSAVYDSVKSMDDAVSAAYRSAREIAPDQKVIKFSALEDKLRKSAGMENVSGGVVSALKGELKNKGVIIKGWSADGKVDVKTAEEIRQFLNSLHDPMRPQGNALVRELKDALDEDVMNTFGDDLFAGARKAKSEMQKIIERGRRDKFDKTSKTFLEDVIYNRVPEEKIVDKLLTERNDSFNHFKGFLLENAGDAGKQAWTDIKAQVIRNALGKATKTQGRGEGGQVVFSSAAFKDALKNLRASGKFDSIFNADEAALIDDIIEIGNLRISPQLVAQGEGPTAFAVNKLHETLLSKVPVVGSHMADLKNALISHKEAMTQLQPLKGTEKALKQVKR